MASPFDPQTLKFYANEAVTYVDRPTDLHPSLATFLNELREGASILELGCGGGREAKHMIDRGFEVEPTDGVPAMAAQAELWLGRPVRVMRFDELEAKETYDAVVANASLLHVPLRELDKVLASIWHALKPGGLFFASYKTGGSEERDEHNRYYNRLSRQTADNLYRSVGTWSQLRFEETFEPGYFGKPSNWLIVIAQRT
jgi:2-polyprenyl-3-methyl-5-hydroxy-6-metoxy-1,4-benzoquinol methylase